MNDRIDTKITPAHIVWASAASKRQAESVTSRVMAIDILELPETVKVLSFPGSDWSWEVGLLTLFTSKIFHITGLEELDDAWKEAVTNQPRLGKCQMHERACSLADFVKMNPRSEPFDIVYLGQMISWNRENHNATKRLFREPSLLNLGGLLILDLELNLSQPKSISELMESAENQQGFATYDARTQYTSNSSYRTLGISQEVIEIALEEGVVLRPLLTNVYYCFASNQLGEIVPHVQFLFKCIES